MTVEVGQTAPDFTLPASNGDSVSLADYRGKYVVFIFLSKRYDTRLYDSSLCFRDQYEKFSELDAVIHRCKPGIQLIDTTNSLKT